MRNMKNVYVSDQSAKLTAGIISRRQFVKSLTAAGFAFSSAFALADKSLASVPRKGGTFRIGMGYGSSTDSLDPANYSNAMTSNMAYAWGNSLTEVNNRGELVPELAENFESYDGKTWRFELRREVDFHHGKTLDSDDVIASINHHRSEDTKSPVKYLLTDVTDIRKDDRYTVVVDLKEPNADFPHIISDPRLIIMPSKDGELDTRFGFGIGTGPYAVTHWEPGARFEAKRHPNYWKQNAAHFEDIQILSILDNAARQDALISGNVDVIDRVDINSVSRLQRQSSISILEKTGTRHYTFPMRLDVEPFGDYDLRMALKYAIKRGELVDKILLGHGALGNDIPLSSANQFFDQSIPQRDFDGERAARHYRRSGHSGSIKLSTSEAAFKGAIQAAELIAQSAKEVGIDIEIVGEPNDGYWSNVWNKKGWCACYWGGRSTADAMFASAYVEATAWNDTAWTKTEAARKFNTLVRDARRELDSAKRTELYAAAQTLLHDDGGALIPMFSNHIMALSKQVVHSDRVAANQELDGYKAAERWWFA